MASTRFFGFFWMGTWPISGLRGHFLRSDESQGIRFIAFFGFFQEIPVVVDELDVKDFSIFVSEFDVESVSKSFLPSRLFQVLRVIDRLLIVC